MPVREGLGRAALCLGAGYDIVSLCAFQKNRKEKSLSLFFLVQYFNASLLFRWTITINCIFKILENFRICNCSWSTQLALGQFWYSSCGHFLRNLHLSGAKCIVCVSGESLLVTWILVRNWWRKILVAHVVEHACCFPSTPIKWWWGSIMGRCVKKLLISRHAGLVFLWTIANVHSNAPATPCLARTTSIRKAVFHIPSLVSLIGHFSFRRFPPPFLTIAGKKNVESRKSRGEQFFCSVLFYPSISHFVGGENSDESRTLVSWSYVRTTRRAWGIWEGSKVPKYIKF